MAQLPGQTDTCAPNRAFTLIELLVAISIMMILMGLSIASVVRAPRLNAMVAAEQVIADCIRQARHTARSSGQPVVLKLKRDERAISGLVRQTLWQGVEGWPTVAGDSAPGRTGTGLMVPEAYATGGVLGTAIDLPTLQLAGMLNTPLLEGGERLWRGAAAPTSRPGLLLSCAVRPPIAGEVRTSGPATPEIVPLVLIGPDGVQPDYDASILGLALVQSNVAGSGSGPARTQVTAAASWEIVGWFGASGQRIEISSISNVPADQAGSRSQSMVNLVAGAGAGGSTYTSGYAESGPLTGGRWTEITLLVEADRMILYRDGRRVGEVAGVGAISLPSLASERIFVGCANTGSLKTADYTQIDDVRVERLGDAMAGQLPSGIRVTDARIVCHPDGRVEVVGGHDQLGGLRGTTPETVITITATSGEQADITVSTTGDVSSLTKVAP